MPDRLFADLDLAALYDLFSPWERRGDFAFYLPRVMAAEAVLDVGCGTGMLLHRARDAGHTGRLCGLDPAVGMLEVARRRTDIEWVLGDLASARWDREFDLIVMTGHAFQVLVDDDDLRTALAAMRSALKPDGRFAFETRNPLAREWERWVPAQAAKVTSADGEVVRMAREVEAAQDDIVRFSHTFTSPGWDGPRRSHSTLRFLGADRLGAFLTEAGLAVEERYGDWDASPLTDVSPEIIVIAARATVAPPSLPA